MFPQSMAEIPSITWIHITFLISVSVCQPQYFPNWRPLTESRKGKVKSLRPEKKFAVCWFGHLILGILQEVWLQKCSALAPWKPSDQSDWFAHAHTHTHTYMTAELMNACLQSYLETCSDSAPVLQDASDCRSCSAFHLPWWRSSRRKRMNELQTKKLMLVVYFTASGWESSLTRKEATASKKENLYEIRVEVTWRDQVCHLSKSRDDFYPCAALKGICMGGLCPHHYYGPLRDSLDRIVTQENSLTVKAIPISSLNLTWCRTTISLQEAV